MKSLTVDVAVSTACLPSGATLRDRLEEYRNLGITTVELGGGVDIDDDWLAVAKGSGLRCLLHGYFPPPANSFVFNLASADEEVARRSIEHVRIAVDASVALGAPFYSLHSGFITDPVGFDGSSFVLPEPSPGDAGAALERFVDRLMIVLADARAKGIELLIENNVCQTQHRGKVLMHSPSEIVTFLERMDQQDLGLLQDTGHLRVSAKTMGFDEGEALEMLRGVVRATHLHENDGREDQHLPVTTQGAQWEALRLVMVDHPVVVESRFQNGSGLLRHLEQLRNALEGA